MSASLVSLLTVLAVLLTLGSLLSLAMDVLQRNRSPLNRRLGEEFHRDQRERARKSSLFKDLDKLASEPFSGEAEVADTWFGRLERMMEQSGLGWTMSRLIATSAGAAALGLLCGIVTGLIIVAAILAAIAGVLPLLYVWWKCGRRLEALRLQLPDAYDLMARALRAGQTVSQTMQGVADEFDQPISGEFSYCYEQQNLGLPTDVALRDLAHRTGLMEVNIFVVAVVVQRQVGGNLAEMLEGLAKVVRERYRIRGAIRTLTAEGRLQAGLLMALPPAMFLAMLVLNRAYALVLLEYPWLLGGVVGSMCLGAMWIRKIINFDF